MRTLHLIVYGLLLCTNVIANTPPSQSLFDSFQGEEVLNITLETDFESILNDSKLEDYQDARFTYKQNGEEQIWDIKVKQRGKYRRRVCDMPPLKLNFSKKDLSNAGLHKFDKMKLVTHCMDDETSRNSVLKEYLTYKLYNELTPYSFRVQLVRITYVDAKRSFRKMKKYGFLIESTSELETRINAKEVEQINVPMTEIHDKQLALAAEFQYFIANADWDIPTLRNVKLFQPAGDAPIIVVPYDFDFSGMVNAIYAIPNKNVGQNHIKERVYMGTVSAPRPKMKQYFQSKWEDLKDVVQAFNTMSWTMQDEVIAYLDTYFEVPTSKEQLPVRKTSYGR